MISQRVLGSRPFNRVKQMKVEKILQVALQNCRGIGECKLSCSSELPFFWAPSNTAEESIGKCIWSSSRKSYQNFDSTYIGYNAANSKYQSLRKLLATSESCLATEEFKSSDTETSNSKIENCKCIQLDDVKSQIFFGDGNSLQIMTLLDNSARSNPTRNSSTRSKEPFENLNYRCVQLKECSQSQREYRISGGIKHRSPKSLHFTKNTKVCLSKNAYSHKKELPGEDELAFEKIIDNLNEEWPNLFSSKIAMDPSLFSDTIYFENAILRTKTRGLKLYKFQVCCFKWASKLFWLDPALQTLQVTKNLEDSTVRIRWLTNGKPRLLYPLILFGRTVPIRYLDFFSVLKVGESGKIESHHLSKLVPRQTTQKRNLMVSILTLLGLSRTNIPDFQEEPVLPSTTEPGQ